MLGKQIFWERGARLQISAKPYSSLFDDFMSEEVQTGFIDRELCDKY